MSEKDGFAIKFASFKSECDEAMLTFDAAMHRITNNSLDKSETSIEFSNALIAFVMDIARAKEKIGLIGAVDESRQRILQFIKQHYQPARFGVAGERLANVTAAYSSNFRPATGGAMESRMQSALIFAARLEQGESVLQMIQELSHDLDPSMNFSAVEKGASTVAQSLKRLRSKLRSGRYLRFDEATLSWKVSHPEDDLWEQLPKGRGRPKSN